MSKFFLGFFAGIIFVGLALTAVFFLGIALAGGRKVGLPSSGVLRLELTGEVPEISPVDLPYPLSSNRRQVTVFEIWQALRGAAGDSRIKAVLLEPRGLNAGWGKLEELRSDILEFKKSGKPVIAYLRGAGNREYYLATAADQIYMAPEDELDVKGLRAELMFLKGTLDKLGVVAEFEHVGKYKDAPDMFTKTGSSPETREVINQLLDQFYRDLVAKISQGRGKKPDDVRRLIDNGPFVGKEALDGGLVDALVYADEALEKLKDRAKNRTLEDISLANYAAALPQPKGTRIALVVGQGEITRGDGDPFSNDGITDGALSRVLKQVREDDSIRGVILRIDSPGGDGIASDELLHQAKLLSQKKPTVISMSDLAASGGYYMAMTGDPLVAYSNTETGSIGVFFGKANLRGLYDKIGVKKEIMTRGRFAAIDSEYVPLDDQQRAKLRSEIELFYRGFVDRVAAARKRPYAQVEPLAQGRVWTGTQARQNGLVDELGGLDRAVEVLRTKAGMAANAAINLVPYPQHRNFLELWLERNENAGLLGALQQMSGSSADAQIRARLRAIAGDLPVDALARGGLLSLVPYHLTVR